MVQVACLCPPPADGTPRHPDGDEITLRERLGFRESLTLRSLGGTMRQLDPLISEAEQTAAVMEHFVLFGVETWTLADAKGQPVPVNRATIREYLLANYAASDAVCEAATERYMRAVFGPLVAAASNSSLPSPTDESTPALTDSGMTSPTLLWRSSTITSQTAATGETSSPPDGDSSTSPSSASAA